MKRTKIVCTLGPATDEPGVLERMARAGMDVARLNFSHGTYEEHEARIGRVREASKLANKHVGILLDIMGPKIRTGNIKGGKVELLKGSRVALTTRPVEGDASVIFVDYAGLPETVRQGSTIFLSDGLIELLVEEVSSEEVRCKVVAGGELSSRKGVTLPGASLDLPPATDKDIRDIRFGIEKGADFIAASFIRNADGVLRVREIVDKEGGEAHIIAKIESLEGIKNIDAIIDVSDGVMIARGDLGVEIPPERVPIVQKMIIEKCNKAGKPVITATEMLESMVRNPRPTRAEVTDVANAIFDGTDAVMLSAETAVGRYPVEAVRAMARIAEETEEALHYEEILSRKRIGPVATVADAISHATCQSALDLGVCAILTSTQSGATARMVSKYRPKAPIIAVTPNEDVACKLSIMWGVKPMVVAPTYNIDAMLDVAVEAGLASGIVSYGDLVAITAGVRTGVPGSTNLLKIHRVETEDQRERGR